MALSSLMISVHAAPSVKNDAVAAVTWGAEGGDISSFGGALAQPWQGFEIGALVGPHRSLPWGPKRLNRSSRVCSAARGLQIPP